MELIRELFTPTALTFLIIAIGYSIRDFKIFNIKLDLSAVLLVAVAVGYLIAVFSSDKDYNYIDVMEEYAKIISTIGTAVFVCIVGITSGYALSSKNRENWLAGLLGCSVAVIGIIIAMVIWKIDDKISVSSLLGVVCGALTTTPGLSAVCELEGILSKEAVLGYGSAYLLGVVFVVVFVQIIALKKYENIHTDSEPDKKTEVCCTHDGMIQICLSIFLGSIIGSIELFGIGFKLGNSGGILCCGIAIGYIVKKLFKEKKASKCIMEKFREFGLSLFFVGAGVPAGIQLKMGFNIKLIFYGAIITIVPILVCYLLCKFFSKSNKVSVQEIIAGGMTSTPAIGVLLQKGKRPNLTQYFYAYIGALVTIMFVLRIVGQIML